METMTKTTKTDGAKPPRVLAAETLKGNKVTNAKGEDLGKVEAIMLDLVRGRIAYVVLSGAHKLLAVPWELLSISFHDKKFILNVSEETLKSAPGFDKNNWPDSGDFDWLAKVYQSYNREPYWK